MVTLKLFYKTTIGYSLHTIRNLPKQKVGEGIISKDKLTPEDFYPVHWAPYDPHIQIQGGASSSFWTLLRDLLG